MSDWRIDELAQRAGVAVDTIRYYQREGLLPSGERNGRTRRFGPEHLERLERIRALQSRRFSLAAIQALLERDDPGALAGLLVGSEESAYDHEELLETAGVDAEFVRDLTDAGLLRDPAEHGRSAYDADDVNVLRALRRPRPPRHPRPRAGGGGPHLRRGPRRDPAPGRRGVHLRRLALLGRRARRRASARSSPAEMERFAHDVRVIADYTQQRNLQRAVLQKIEEHGATDGERAGGYALRIR